jgi:hypothetical protein
MSVESGQRRPGRRVGKLALGLLMATTACRGPVPTEPQQTTTTTSEASAIQPRIQIDCSTPTAIDTPDFTFKKCTGERVLIIFKPEAYESAAAGKTAFNTLLDLNCEPTGEIIATSNITILGLKDANCLPEAA